MAKEVNHSERAHALLSASGASRWINCTPSARLEEKFDVSTRSSYAREGEVAHELAELMLHSANGDMDDKTFNRELRKLKSNKLWNDEMIGYVEHYVNYCMEQKAEFGDEAQMLIEERVDFSHVVPQGFGTGDNTILAPEIMEFVDLKYGKGIKVSAENNPQLRLYALGALRNAELLFPIETIRMTIVQPRLSHISTEEISVQELLEWADEIKPIAKMAHRGEGDKRAGAWCRFCKVKPTCPAIAKKSLEVAKADFEDPAILNIERLVELRTQFPMIQDWMNSVERFLLEKALNNEPIPGLKLVEGRANRKWTNETQVIEALKSMRIAKKHFIAEKLIGIPAIEKMLKDDQMEKIAEFIIKPPGKPTLVDLNDPRPARGIQQAKTDFADD